MLLPPVLLATVGAFAFQPDVVANKLIKKIGVNINFKLDSLITTVLKPADGAGGSEIKALIIAIVALVFIGAIVYFLFGILSTLGGRRGGIEKVGAVVFALVAGVAIFEVIT